MQAQPVRMVEAMLSHHERTRKAAAMNETTHVRMSSIHGRGVFAARTLRAGALIGHYEGERTQRDGRYVLWVEDGDALIGIHGRNHLRYLNHSPTPNAALYGTELFAIKRIESGTEVTIDYGEEWALAHLSCSGLATRRRRRG